MARSDLRIQIRRAYNETQDELKMVRSNANPISRLSKAFPDTADPSSFRTLLKLFRSSYTRWFGF
ncbi:hypothetical protein N7509_006017 [Penicillium cosmopolitanum]|uniref:Uncharacterized protein n=1 Tax=Penicillium cosmopolitanum TaxID=1131564 RepID=A0A9W9W393_9EURO|nr:uncharacterized protein N7509_006017 [Penicillium cosmopolitanum]KAJ5397904.1 hypothetical protein N7509_006017 [Penicillium cosmopolitanum]